jgi:hypothetical protein
LFEKFAPGSERRELRADGAMIRSSRKSSILLFTSSKTKIASSAKAI